jgi:antitoxin (DNA-binding transcriptional repressor) of toxin-antitoxin stability system
MRRIELTDATHSLAEYAAQLGDEPLVVTKRGKPIATLVAIHDADWESLALSTDPDFIQLIVRARARERAEGSISHEEIMREFNVALPRSNGRPAPPARKRRPQPSPAARTSE